MMSIKRIYPLSSLPKLYPILLILVVWAIILPSTLTRGIQADEGVHLTVAQGVAEGQVVYRDLFENRTPAAEWGLAGLIRLGARPLESGRLLALGAMLLSGCALITLTRLCLRQFQPAISQPIINTAAFTAGTFFLLTPLNLFWSRFFIFEPFITLFILLAAIKLIGTLDQNGPPVPHKMKHWVIAGLWLGIGVLTKQTVLVTVVAFFTFLAIYTTCIVYIKKGAWLSQFQMMVSWIIGGRYPPAWFWDALVCSGCVLRFPSIYFRGEPAHIGSKLLRKSSYICQLDHYTTLNTTRICRANLADCSTKAMAHYLAISVDMGRG